MLTLFIIKIFYISIYTALKKKKKKKEIMFELIKKNVYGIIN